MVVNKQANLEPHVNSGGLLLFRCHENFSKKLNAW
jgi:hypothetical protein